MRGERCVLAGQDAFKRVFECFENMFSREWAYSNDLQGTRAYISLNDRIYDTAELFCQHIRGKEQYMPFRRDLWATA